MNSVVMILISKLWIFLEGPSRSFVKESWMDIATGKCVSWLLAKGNFAPELYDFSVEVILFKNIPFVLVRVHSQSADS